MYPGIDYSKLAQQQGGANQQFTQGIDPDWTNLAMMYGYRPNPYPAAGTEGQDQMRFLATLKNISDAQLGGAGGRYSQMSPNNPIAAMPFGMSQYMAAMAPLFQSIQGRNLLPMNQADMFGGGYQYGGINTGQESSLMQALRTARTGGPVGQNQAPNASGTAPTTSGPAPDATAPSGPAGVSPSDLTPVADTNSTAASSQVSGGNTPDQTAPTSGSQDIRAGVEQQAASRPPSASGAASDRQDRIDAATAKSAPPPLAQAWNAYIQSRTNAQYKAENQTNLDFWKNPVFQDFANWVKQNVR